MDEYISIEKYSFLKEIRIPLLITVVCLVTSICGFILGSYGVAAINAFVVILNVIIIYKNLPPKWARKEMKGMKGGYSNKDFIDHLAEDLHSEVGIKIYDDK